MNTEMHQSFEQDLWELHRLQEQLKGWEFSGQHHMHKSWQFSNAVHALEWHQKAKKICDTHGGEYYFYLANVGSGRIDMDILSSSKGRLTRESLEVAMILNALESDAMKSPNKIGHDNVDQSVRFIQTGKICDTQQATEDPLLDAS